MPKYDTAWNESWLSQTDSNGDQLSEWVVHESRETIYCRWCKKKGISFSNQGIQQVKQHSKSQKHRQVADVKKRRNVTQQVLVSTSAAELDGQNNSQQGVPQQRNRFVIQSLAAPATHPRMELSISDRVTAAETLLVLKAVESNYSYNSMNDWKDILSKADPKSDIFPKMQLSDRKVSYVVSKGFYPYFHEQLVTDVRGAPAFTISVDSSSFKLDGLTTHCERVVRFWSSRVDEVVDKFLDLSKVGHETAKVVVDHMVAGLDEDGLSLVNMLQLSRDNPNVMKAVFTGLKEAAEKAGNPKLLDAPCLLHPTHNAFRSCVTSLDVNISDVLNDIHSFFKLSSGRREDLLEVRGELREKLGNEFEEPMKQFFLRHVSSRWLEMLSCLKRLISLWESTKEYFLVYLRESTSQADKLTVQSDRYDRIVSFFKKSEEMKNKTRVQYLIYIATLCHPFLVSLQAAKPLVHELLPRCVILFRSILITVLQADVTQETTKDLAKIKFVGDELKDPKDCDFGPGVSACLANLSSDKKTALKSELRKATVILLKHIQKNFPWEDKFINCLRYVAPNERGTDMMSSSLIFLAKHIGRHSQEELEELAIQLNCYQVLPADLIPSYDEKVDRLDHWWRSVFPLIEKTMGTSPQALIKLIKMICTLSHGQSMIERGFSDTKKLSSNRESLNEESVKGQKTTKDAIRTSGGSCNVSLTAGLLNAVKGAHAKKVRDDLENEKKRAEEKKASEAAERERLMRDELDEAHRGWEERRLKMEADLKLAMETEQNHDKVLKDSLDRAMKVKNTVSKDAAMVVAKTAQIEMANVREQIDYLNKKLKKHMLKKPKSE